VEVWPETDEEEAAAALASLGNTINGLRRSNGGRPRKREAAFYPFLSWKLGRAPLVAVSFTPSLLRPPVRRRPGGEKPWKSDESVPLASCPYSAEDDDDDDDDATWTLKEGRAALPRSRRARRGRP